MKSESTIRLQKFLADQGLCSRREAEHWIGEQRVRVNGKYASLGDKVDPFEDAIFVDKKRIMPRDRESVVLMMNKPKGFVCTNKDPFSKNTVFALIPKKYLKYRLFCMGRLDQDSEGLLLLSNDGGLTHKITHPSHNIIKSYEVTLDRPLDHKLIPQLMKGIEDEGEHLFAHRVIPIFPEARIKRIKVELTQGRKREIRRLFQAFDYRVDRLKRFQIGQLKLYKVPVGTFKVLSEKEIELIFKQSAQA